MDGYLLDTCVISALLEEKHPFHDAVRDAVDKIEKGAPRYVSAITIAEIMFGALVDEALIGYRRQKIWDILEKAQESQIREITRHTRREYSELRKNLAVTHLHNVLRSQRSRWVDHWHSKITGDKLRIEENDLWICAQALELNLILITTDRKMYDAVGPADPRVRFILVAKK